MNKETLALIIAQNGLGTATTVLIGKAAGLRRKASKAKDAEAKAKFEDQAQKAEKLAAAFRIANNGVAEYMAEFSE